MSWYLLPDIIVVLLILTLTAHGAHRGAFMSLSGVVSLFTALFGGVWAARVLSSLAARLLFLPEIRKLLARAGEETGFSGLAEGLASLLEQTELPGFLTFGTAEQAIGEAAQSGAELLEAAACIVAERLSSFLIFLFVFILLLVLVQLLFRALNLVFTLPILAAINRFFGALFGGCCGILLAAALFWAAYKLLPHLFLPGEILSASSVQKTYIVNWFYTNMMPLLP